VKPHSPFGVRHRDLLILDAGPIRELILFHAIHELGFLSLSPQLSAYFDRLAHQQLSNFLGLFRERTTSASVVAELYRWIRDRTDPSGHRQLWERIYQEFRNMGMNEEVIQLLDMPIGVVAAHGPVDASLLELARRHLSRNPSILTVDAWLAHECRKARVALPFQLIEVCHGEPV
jgi:hypothetical protein